MKRVWSLAAIGLLAGSVGTARAADVPTSYTVSATALKAAVAGTNLTFTLFTTPAAPSKSSSRVSRWRTSR